MNYKFQRIGVWSGIGFFFLFWASCVNMMGFVPPPSPTLNGTELLATYQAHLFGARGAIMVAYLAALLLVPWSAMLYTQLAKIEGKHPMMSVTALGAGIANAVAFYLPFVFWAAAIYRMDRPPELILMISDMAWLEFIMLYAPYAVQTIAIALVGLTDKSPTPTFPRWFCFMSIWVAILVVPGGFAEFFYTGPFAWNGIIAFWVPVTAFCIYYAAMFPLMFKAIKRQEMAERAA